MRSSVSPKKPSKAKSTPTSKSNHTGSKILSKPLNQAKVAERRGNTDPANLVSKLKWRDEFERRVRLGTYCSADNKYDRAELRDYLTPQAEWRACAVVQQALLETRVEFGRADPKFLPVMERALAKFDPLNVALLEDKLRHDQLAVLAELGRHGGEQLKAVLHPGTTSYDILDTARSWLFKRAWFEVMRPTAVECVEKLAKLGEELRHLIQAGRTHLQLTSPVTFGHVFALFGARLIGAVEHADGEFNSLKGKVSGIVGSGASVEAVIGRGQAARFEVAVLEKLGLAPDRTATQIVQKQNLLNVGNSIVSMTSIIANLANDLRILYSSEINEVTGKTGAKELGGSSADASKNNPIAWENIAGAFPEITAAYGVLVEITRTDLQRDLRASRPARSQPQLMMVSFFDVCKRLSKALDDIGINEKQVKKNVLRVRRFPSEAMVAILRAHAWKHPTLGIGHDFVKEISKTAKRTAQPLLLVALADEHFKKFFFDSLSEQERQILQGKLELSLGDLQRRVDDNLKTARGTTLNLKTDGASIAKN